MNREEYNNCMSGKLAKLKDSELPQKTKFCVSAKECSKNMGYNEALRVCNLPKEEKPPSSKKKKAANIEMYANCLFGNVDKDTSVEQILKILKKCKEKN